MWLIKIIRQIKVIRQYYECNLWNLGNGKAYKESLIISQISFTETFQGIFLENIFGSSRNFQKIEVNTMSISFCSTSISYVTNIE